MLFKDKIRSIWIAINKHFLMPFCLSVSVIFIALSIFGLKFYLLTNSITLYTGLVFGFLAFFMWFKKLDDQDIFKKYIIEFFTHLFLLVVFLITFFNLNFDFINKLHLPQITNIILITISIFTGFIIYYSEEEAGMNAEQTKSGRIKMGTKYLVVLIILLFIGSILLFYNLGKNNFMNDEFPTIEAANGYLNQGNFWKWDWLEKKSGQITNCAQEDEYCNYTRAEIHTILLSLSYRVFGISEFSSRFVSAIFVLLLFILFFFIKKELIYDKKIVLLSLLVLIFSPKIVEFARYARMYAILMPFFLLLQYFIFKIIYEIVIQKLNYSKILFYFFSIVILFGICYNLHSQSLIIFIPTIIYLYYLFIKHNKYNHLYILVIISLLSITGLKIMWPHITSFETATEFINFGSRINYEYVDLLFGYPIGWIGFSLSTALFFKYIFTKNNKEGDYYIFSYLICITQLFVLIFVIDRFSHPVYISNILPLSIFISVYSLNYFINFFFKKKYITFLILIPMILFFFYSNIEYIYGNKNFYYANYTDAYKSIILNYDSDKDAIFMSYSKKYYLRDLVYKEGGFHLFGNKDYSQEAENDFMEKIKSYDSGFITWDLYSEGDIKTSIKEYIYKNFKQLAGSGIDNTRVEVFYFKK